MNLRREYVRQTGCYFPLVLFVIFLSQEIIFDFLPLDIVRYILWEIIEYSCTSAFARSRVRLYIGAILTGILKRVENTDGLQKTNDPKDKHVTVDDRKYMKMSRNEVDRIILSLELNER